MLRTISILALMAYTAATMAEAKPILFKVFAPSVGYSSGSYQNTVGLSPFNTQLISSLISSKIQLLNSVMQAKYSAGGFRIGLNKSVTLFSSTTTTEKPLTHYTTEVNTDFTADDISTTQLVYTKTTEGADKTPSPTISPEHPVHTSMTSVIPIDNTTLLPEVTTMTTATTGYFYTTIHSPSHYLPAILSQA
ncbi:uncharacterized protein [Drosophila suzukii]|uniref:Uncharacterized protein isoform X1 n=1 Tax=Drosophila suzukii TaxID=28584 RepID=A0ABM4TPS8_DROSZ